MNPASHADRPLDEPRLTPGQMQALRNLAQKQTGAPVDFINIGDARALTELGLAARTQQGWEISAAGVRLLREADGHSDLGAR